MKSIIKISLLLILLVSKMQAQTSRAGSTGIPAGTFTVNGKTFIAFVDTQTYPSSGERMAPNTMNVFLQSGTIMNPPANPPLTRECLASVFIGRGNGQNKPDFLRYFNILRSVFPPARCTAIFNNDNSLVGMIGVSCVFNVTANGVVKDIAFSISENNIITPQEIELLHTRLMQQMSFTLAPVNCPSYAGFMFEDEMRNLEDFNIIHTAPYYFGNGPAWKNK